MTHEDYTDQPTLCPDEWREYASVLTKPPRRVPTPIMVDGPLMGNGDVGVVLGGPVDCLEFFLCKNDFWYQAHVGETRQQRMERLHTGLNRRTGTRIIMLGMISIVMPELKNASYFVEQDICNAEVRGRFLKGDAGLETTSFVAAGENLLVITLENTGRGPIAIELRQKPCSAANSCPEPPADQRRRENSMVSPDFSRRASSSAVAGWATLDFCTTGLCGSMCGTAGPHGVSAALQLVQQCLLPAWLGKPAMPH